MATYQAPYQGIIDYLVDDTALEEALSGGAGILRLPARQRTVAPFLGWGATQGPGGNQIGEVKIMELHLLAVANEMTALEPIGIALVDLLDIGTRRRSDGENVVNIITDTDYRIFSTDIVSSTDVYQNDEDQWAREYTARLRYLPKE